jgi:predicted O-linked N-acetylglucosamine transferase (SPINDLY family)
MLRAAGLDRFIAGSPRECAKIAMDCAADLRGLAVLRRGMRKRMAESALTDGRRYAWEVERAYLRMWKEWSRCAVAAG